MTEDEIRQWIESRSPDARLSTLWDEFTQHAWRRERQRYVTEISSVSFRQLYEWAKDRPIISGTDKERIQAAAGRQSGVNEDTLNDYQRRRLELIESWVFDKSLPSFLDAVTASVTEVHVQTIFQLNPTKQNYYERLACEWISSRSGVPTVRLAAASSRLNLRFRQNGDAVIDGARNDADCKSVDLVSVVDLGDEVRCFIAAHKFARTSGGHQNNQLRDAEVFLTCAMRALERKVEIDEVRAVCSTVLGRSIEASAFTWEPVLILDGSYFSREIEKFRQSELAASTFVGNSDEFAVFVGRLLP